MTYSIEPYQTHFQSRYNLDISVYDYSFLQQIIRCRMNAVSCKTNNEYLLLLDVVPAESTEFLFQLSNSYSEFFRNPLTFAWLEQSFIPRLFIETEKSNSREIRIWSAGCAAGQEPYSLAILLNEYKNSRATAVGYRIFATDDSLKELDQAKRGIFDFKSVKNVRLEFADKYFRRSGDNFLIDDQIKAQVDFSRYDLLDKDSSAPPSSIYGDFDLVMCSNVLFYYQPQYQQAILQKIFRALRPGGLLVTGEAETAIVKASGGFRQHGIPAPVFVKNLIQKPKNAIFRENEIQADFRSSE